MFRTIPELSKEGGSGLYLLAIAINSTIEHTTHSRVVKKVVAQSNHLKMLRFECKSIADYEQFPLRAF